jgi:hypothetical protein
VNSSPYALSVSTSAVIVPTPNSSKNSLSLHFLFISISSQHHLFGVTIATVLSLSDSSTKLPTLQSKSDSRTRQLIELSSSHKAGGISCDGIKLMTTATGHDLSGREVNYRDTVTRYVHVVPHGFPVGSDHAGMLDQAV